MTTKLPLSDVDCDNSRLITVHGASVIRQLCRNALVLFSEPFDNSVDRLHLQPKYQLDFDLLAYYFFYGDVQAIAVLGLIAAVRTPSINPAVPFNGSSKDCRTFRPKGFQKLLDV